MAANDGFDVNNDFEFDFIGGFTLTKNVVDRRALLSKIDAQATDGELEMLAKLMDRPKLRGELMSLAKNVLK